MHNSSKISHSLKNQVISHETQASASQPATASFRLITQQKPLLQNPNQHHKEIPKRLKRQTQTRGKEQKEKEKLNMQHSWARSYTHLRSSGRRRARQLTQMKQRVLPAEGYCKNHWEKMLNRRTKDPLSKQRH